MHEKKEPPLGLRPKYIVATLRVIEIAEAVLRYAHAQKEIPDEWIYELGVVNKAAHPKLKKSNILSGMKEQSDE